MRRAILSLAGIVLALMLVAVLGFCSYGEEAHRFYSIIYDCSKTRDTALVVANASNRDTSYTLEVYDSLGNLLLTAPQSLTSFDSYWHNLTGLINDEVDLAVFVAVADQPAHGSEK